MKKLLTTLLVLLTLPMMASATTAVPWFQTNLTDTFITPNKVNGTVLGIQVLGASSTLQNFTARNATTTNATTTNFAISGISSGNCLHTTTGGAIIGTGSDCGSGGGGSAFPFTPQSWGVSTTTTVGFFNGLLSTGSTTISGVNISPFLNGSWIDLPTTGPSGIGSGGAGVNTWIAYVFNSNQYLSDSITGDIAYRGALGKRLIFGIDNGGGNAPSTMQITANGINVVGGATSTQATSTNAFATTQTVTNFYGAGLTSCANASNALTWSGGQFGCNTISGSGGGTDVNWSFFNNSGIKLGTTTNQVLVSSTGHTATTSLAKLEVGSESAAKGSLLVDASSTLQNFTGVNSTTTNATTTSLAISSLATPGGSFLAVNPQGSVIATTSPLSSGTTTIYIDQNSTKTVTDGTIQFPYKTLTSAIKSYPATYFLSPGTYNEASCNLAFNATSTIWGGKATVLCWSGAIGGSGAGTITFNKGITFDNATIALGNVNVADTAPSDQGLFTNVTIAGGNLNLYGFDTVNGGTLTGGKVYTAPGSLTAFTFIENTDIIDVGDVANFDTMDFNVTGTGAGTYGLTASSSGIIQINGMSYENLAAGGGGIYCGASNGATASRPFAISSLNGTVSTTTNLGAINCGSTALEAGPYSFVSTTNGASLFANNTNPQPFDFLGVNTEGTTSLALFGGFVGIGTSTPSTALDIWSSGNASAIKLQGNSSSNSSTFTIQDNTTTNSLFSSQLNPSGTNNTSFGTVPLSATFQTGAGNTGGLIFFNKAAAPIVFATGGNAFTNEVFRVASNGLVGIGTTTPKWALQIASSTGAQLTLSDSSSLASNHWSFRNAGGNLYIATSSPTTFATSSATSALSIISNGNVGIGSTTPFRKFSVQDGALQALTFGADNGSVSALTQYGNGFAEYREESGPVDFRFGATSFNGSQLGYVETVGATEIDIMPNQIARMDFTGDGYIGVGTTTPKWQFQIASSTAPQLTLTDNTNINHWSFRNAGGNFYLATSSPTTFATSTVSAFSINASGIPTFPALGGATGCAQFSSAGVMSNTGSACGSGGGSAYPFGLTGNATSTKTQFNGGLTAFASSTIGDSTQANGLTVSGGATTTLTQYVGTTLTVGSTTPYATVSINAAAQTNPYLAIGSTTSKVLEVNPQSYPTIAAGTTTPTALFAFNATTTSTVSGLDTFIIASSTSSTNDQTFLRLTRTGSMFAPNTLTQSGAATDYWCYDANGQFIRVSNTCTVSALKFKQDIHPLTLDALSIVNQMQPVTYNLKQPMSADENREQIGFIADWSANLLPDFILHDSNGDIHGFNYEQYTAVLTKAIQQLSAEAGKAKRSAEENWQDGLIALLILGFIYQQVQIRKLKK